MSFDKKRHLKGSEFKELKESYREKEQTLAAYFKQVSARDFYRELFVHNLEHEGQDCSITTGVGNIMCVFLSPADGKMHTKIITEEQRDYLDKIYQDNRCALISPITYYGRTAKARNARYIFAVTIDLDYVSKENLVNLISQAQNDIIPMPTYIVNSGTGLHLYYVFSEPLPAYPATRESVAAFKRALTRVVWNNFTSEVRAQVKRGGEFIDQRQYQGAVQGYRVIGSLSKLGTGYPVTAWESGKQYELEGLNKFLHKADQDAGLSADKCRYKSETPLSEARELWPDWYERRVVKKDPPKKWKKSRGLYDWWLSQISENASYGHRYHCVAMLAVYGVKCDVPEKDVLADAWGLFDRFNELNPNEPFTEDELKKAVKGFYKRESYTLPISSIEHLSGIKIERSKRNGLPRNMHLEVARLIKANKKKMGMVLNDGAPTKQQLVKAWRAEHPDGKKIECQRDTGLSRPTILKWWD